MKAFRKMKEVGLANIVIGFVKREKHKKLAEKYHFDAWHIQPYEWKEYIQQCAKYLNAQNCKTVVDIGCGLGELLRHVKAEKKVGMDVHEDVIAAAREIGDGTVTFETGSFDELAVKPIDYLVTLNFMHGGTEDTWKRPYRMVAEQNDIKHFMVDTVPAKGESHFLDWSQILPDQYKRVEQLGPFLGGRYVEVWEKE